MDVTNSYNYEIAPPPPQPSSIHWVTSPTTIEAGNWTPSRKEGKYRKEGKKEGPRLFDANDTLWPLHATKCIITSLVVDVAQFGEAGEGGKAGRKFVSTSFFQWQLCQAWQTVYFISLVVPSFSTLPCPVCVIDGVSIFLLWKALLEAQLLLAKKRFLFLERTRSGEQIIQMDDY